jgi:hypothetical protein
MPLPEEEKAVLLFQFIKLSDETFLELLPRDGELHAAPRWRKKQYYSSSL